MFHGDERRKGYFQFNFTVDLRKKRYIRGLGSKRKYIEEVVLREVKNSSKGHSLVGSFLEQRMG